MGKTATDLMKDLSPNFWHGAKTVGTSALQLFPSHLDISKGVQLKASAGNSDIIHVGRGLGVTADEVDDTAGFPLAAGEGLLIPVSDLTKIHVIADAISQELHWFAI